MPLAVLHCWCFPPPQNMYALPNCAEGTSCWAKPTSQTETKHPQSHGFFLSRQLWVSDVAHIEKQYRMNRSLFLDLQSGSQELL